jgi:hypothetical protein
VERLRTWIFERNLQIPPLFVELDEPKERLGRTGTLTKWKNKGARGTADVMTPNAEAA